MPTKVGLFGLGSIGMAIASALNEEGVDVSAAIDSDPGKVGRDVGSLLGKPLGVEISDKLDPKVGQECEVFLHSTCSRFEEAFPQIAKLVDAGCNVISTCEELSYPYLRNPELSQKMEELARGSGVTVLGTGVNPGFLLDALPVFITKVCKSVESISASRFVEASLRREPLQRKIGLGMDPREFNDRAEKGSLGHVGLFESCALIAAAMGWELSEIRQDIQPVIADRAMDTPYFTIAPGQVRGMCQEATGMMDGTKIRLYLEMSVGAEEPGDSVKIIGDPPIDLFVKGGVNGDLATVGRVIRHIDDVLAADPGLKTVLDLSMVPQGPRPHLFGSTKLTGTAKLL